MTQEARLASTDNNILDLIMNREALYAYCMKDDKWKKYIQNWRDDARSQGVKVNTAKFSNILIISIIIEL